MIIKIKLKGQISFSDFDNQIRINNLNQVQIENHDPLSINAYESFNEIINGLKDNNQYEDNTFYGNRALFNDPFNKYKYIFLNTPDREKKLKLEIKWFRPSEINSIDLIHSQNTIRDAIINPHAIDNRQGQLGNCWLIASISLLANKRDFLENIFMTSLIPQYKCRKYGCYPLKLCINGIWSIITIDDRLPCLPDKTLRYSKTYKNQLYSSFIEKALAKVNKNYESLEAGSFPEGINKLCFFLIFIE